MQDNIKRFRLGTDENGEDIYLCAEPIFKEQIDAFQKEQVFAYEPSWFMKKKSTSKR